MDWLRRLLGMVTRRDRLAKRSDEVVQHAEDVLKEVNEATKWSRDLREIRRTQAAIEGSRLKQDARPR